MTRQNGWNFDTTYTVGDVLYADTTSTLTKLNPGSNGQVLTLASGVPSWAPAGGSGSWELIQTQTASTSSSIEFTGLSSTYFQYKVELSNVRPGTDNVDFQMRTSSNGGSSYDAGATDYFGPAQGSRILIGSAVGNGTDENTDATITIYNPSTTTWTMVYVKSFFRDRLGQFQNNQWGTTRTQAALVDAVQFTMSGGNIASGTFKLYGLNAS